MTLIQSRTRGTLANSHQIEYRDPHFGVVGGANEMSTWIYGSDPRGQITSARKRLDAAAGAPFAPGWDASYTYDDLGNRVTWGQGSAQQSDLSDLEPTSYSRNALHQYTAITGVNASRVTGQAPASQEVKINGVTAERAGHFYHRRVQDGARSDLTLPHWLEVTVTATTMLPNQQTVTAQRAGSLWQPPIPEEPVYDFDGNLIEDGRWLYTWDAENRLIQMLTRPAAVAAGAPNWRLSFAYDHQSRRIQKKVEVLNGSVWEVRSDARFIYDGWNVVAEVELNGAAWDAPGGTSAMDPRPAYVRRSWVWGEDVSGTLDGAGGVGGLLVVTRHARGGQGRESYWAMSDLNGNVTGLVSTTSGRMAVYEYDAFGRLLRENEPEPGLNPVRFSSKYQDVETGLVYYGYRYYSPDLGRWISRDPIEEQGGLNLYGMVGNDAVNKWDYLGLVGNYLTQHSCPKPSKDPKDEANEQFNESVRAFFSGGGSRSYGQNDPWTVQMRKKAVYERMRNYIKSRANMACNSRRGDDGQSIVGQQKKWDDSADDQPWYQFLRDGANYILGFEMKSTGSVKGTFTITNVNCCCGAVSFSVELNDELRLGSMSRIPGRIPIIGDTELLADRPNWTVELSRFAEGAWGVTGLVRWGCHDTSTQTICRAADPERVFAANS